MNFRLLSTTVLVSLSCTSFKSNPYLNSLITAEVYFLGIQGYQTNLISQEESNNFSTRGFDFEFTGCEANSDNEVSCGFKVTNKKEPRNIKILPRESKIVDRESDSFFGSNARFDEQKANSAMSLVSQTEITKELATEEVAEGEVIFKNIFIDNIDDISYIEFSFNQFKVWFTPKNADRIIY